jgi:hypothetical protein
VNTGASWEDSLSEISLDFLAPGEEPKGKSSRRVLTSFGPFSSLQGKKARQKILAESSELKSELHFRSPFILKLEIVKPTGRSCTESGRERV